MPVHVHWHKPKGDIYLFLFQKYKVVFKYFYNAGTLFRINMIKYKHFKNNNLNNYIGVFVPWYSTLPS